MENNQDLKCKVCDNIGKPFKDSMNYHNIHTSDKSKEFATKLENCIKCESCGYSWIPDKTNLKQYKELDVHLFKSYIDKFSEEHKFNMFLIVLREMKLDKHTESNIMTLVALKDI